MDGSWDSKIQTAQLKVLLKTVFGLQNSLPIIQAIPHDMVEVDPCPINIFAGLSHVCDFELPPSKCHTPTVFNALASYVYNEARPIWENNQEAA